MTAFALFMQWFSTVSILLGTIEISSNSKSLVDARRLVVHLSIAWKMRAASSSFDRSREKQFMGRRKKACNVLPPAMAAATPVGAKTTRLLRESPFSRPYHSLITRSSRFLPTPPPPVMKTFLPDRMIVFPTLAMSYGSPRDGRRRLCGRAGRSSALAPDEPVKEPLGPADDPVEHREPAEDANEAANEDDGWPRVGSAAADAEDAAGAEGEISSPSSSCVRRRSSRVRRGPWGRRFKYEWCCKLEPGDWDGKVELNPAAPEELDEECGVG